MVENWQLLAMLQSLHGFINDDLSRSILRNEDILNLG